jgi:integrase
VAALVKAPAERAGRPSKSLTVEQAQELLRAAAGSRLYAYVVLSVTTGVRTEELRALERNEVDLDVGAVAVYRVVRATAATKTSKSRRVLSLPLLAVGIKPAGCLRIGWLRRRMPVTRRPRAARSALPASQRPGGKIWPPPRNQTSVA